MNIVCDESLLDCGGVYVIKNTVNDKIYIGSAVQFRRRLGSHKYDLNRSRHCNHYLQRSWKKYGADAFTFGIIEIVKDQKQLIETEQKWLDKLRPYERATGYNICANAGNTLGFRLSPEARARKSASQMGRPGRPVSEGMKKLLSQKRSKEYIVIDPDGNPEIIFNLKKFCQEKGLSHSNLNSVANGNAAYCCGWRCEHVTPENLEQVKNGFKYPKIEIKKIHRDGYVVTDPTFKSFFVERLEPFCKERGLEITGMQSVSFGRVHHCKGWQCEYATPENLKQLEEGTFKPKREKLRLQRQQGVIAIAPDGTLHKVDNLSRFCKEHGLDATSMVRVARGQLQYCKLWRCQFLSNELLTLFEQGGKLKPFSPKPLGRKYLVISPQGKYLEIQNLNAFCKKNGLSQPGMQGVAGGKSSHYKGWVCKFIEDAPPLPFTPVQLSLFD